jgi:hypothetical protein
MSFCFSHHVTKLSDCSAVPGEASGRRSVISRPIGGALIRRRDARHENNIDCYAIRHRHQISMLQTKYFAGGAEQPQLCHETVRPPPNAAGSQNPTSRIGRLTFVLIPHHMGVTKFVSVGDTAPCRLRFFCRRAKHRAVAANRIGSHVGTKDASLRSTRLDR